MGKKVDLLFTVSVWTPFWGLVEHAPLIIVLFLPIVSFSNWKGPWTIRGSDWGCGAVRAIELECKR